MSAYNTSEMQEYSADNGSLVTNAEAEGSAEPNPPVATRQSKRVKIEADKATNDISTQQLEALNTAYTSNNTPTNSERRRIAIDVGVSLPFVNNYYREKRAPEKEPKDLTPMNDNFEWRSKSRFTKEQHEILAKEFSKTPHPSMKERQRIAIEMGIANVARISNYFQNRNRKGVNSKPHRAIEVEEDEDEEAVEVDSPRMTIFGTPAEPYPEPFPEFAHEFATSTTTPQQNRSSITFSSSSSSYAPMTRPAVAAQTKRSLVVKLPISQQMLQQISNSSTSSALPRPSPSLDNTPMPKIESSVTITTILNTVAKMDAENAQLQRQKADMSAVVESGRQQIDDNRKQLEAMKNELARLETVQEKAMSHLETTNQRIKAIDERKAKLLSQDLKFGADFGDLFGDGE